MNGARANELEAPPPFLARLTRDERAIVRDRARIAMQIGQVDPRDPIHHAHRLLIELELVEANAGERT